MHDILILTAICIRHFKKPILSLISVKLLNWVINPVDVFFL